MARHVLPSSSDLPDTVWDYKNYCGVDACTCAPAQMSVLREELASVGLPEFQQMRVWQAVGDWSSMSSLHHGPRVCKDSYVSPLQKIIGSLTSDLEHELHQPMTVTDPGRFSVDAASSNDAVRQLAIAMETVGISTSFGSSQRLILAFQILGFQLPSLRRFKECRQLEAAQCFKKSVHEWQEAGLGTLVVDGRQMIEHDKSS